MRRRCTVVISWYTVEVPLSEAASTWTSVARQFDVIAREKIQPACDMVGVLERNSIIIVKNRVNPASSLDWNQTESDD